VQNFRTCIQRNQSIPDGELGEHIGVSGQGEIEGPHTYCSNSGRYVSRPLISLARELDTPESHLDKLADEVRQDLASK
jgi:hypothetical protein